MLVNTHAWTPQPYQPASYIKNAGFVADLGASLIDVLQPRPNERILDLGCGDGRLSLKIAEAGASVLCVDSSPEMVEACRASGLDAQVCDGAALPFEHEFDAVFSNAALHWMTDAKAVVSGVTRALRPGGRFVAEFGGKGNVDVVCRSLRASLLARGVDPGAGPWFFPSADEYAGLLEGSGFRVESIDLFERPTPLPTGLDGWLDTFWEPWVALLPPDADRAAVKAEVLAAAAPSLRDENGQWIADYWRLRFAAVLPG